MDLFELFGGAIVEDCFTEKIVSKEKNGKKEDSTKAPIKRRLLA